MNFEHSVEQNVCEHTISFAFWRDVAYEFIESYHRKSHLFIEPIQHLFLAEKVLIQFLVQIFRILAPTYKVVGIGQFENVDVRHLAMVSFILRQFVIRFAVKTDLASHSTGESTPKMNNVALLAEYAAFEAAQRVKHITRLRKNFPEFKEYSDTRLNEIYNECVSCFQSKGGGSFLQKYVETHLTIPYSRQVHLDNKGFIVKSGGTSIPDIVFGNPVPGTHISEYPVMALKTSSRERWKTDLSLALKYSPKLFLYTTITDDYPDPTTYGESDKRMLVCATPRAGDLRRYKLGFEDVAGIVSPLL